MAKTKLAAANDVTNTANGTIGMAEAQYPQVNQRITGAGDVSAGRASGDYGTASNAYSDMANTGGFTDAQKNAYLNQATEGVKNSYDVLGEQAKLAGARTGASNTGAVISQMARQGANAQSQAMNDASVGLNQQVNANKLAGAGGEAGLFGQNQNAATTANEQYLQGTGSEFSTLNAANQNKNAATQNYDSSVLSPVLDPISQITSAAANAGKAYTSFFP